MAGKIPLKLQLAIRDYWEKDTAAVNIARASLRDVLGYPVRIDPEWVQLLAALDKSYPDRQTLVQAVAGCVEIWCLVMADLLEGADNADAPQQAWLETLMEKLEPQAGLRLYITVVGDNPAQLPQLVTEPGTAWADERTAFLLYLPGKRAVTVAGEFEAAYRGGILNCFKATPAPKDLAHRPAAGETDEWADVEMDTATGRANIVQRPAASSSADQVLPKLEFLPSLDSLPRPDELFLRPPYHLIVADYGNKKIVVQGSHSPSLHLLGEYMKRWVRINHQDSRRPAAVEVLYNQSCWGASPMFDSVTLTSEANNIFQFNPAMVLAFVEGVLGYDKVSTEQGIWTYRRLLPFKG